jgi:hypothetical protein
MHHSSPNVQTFAPKKHTQILNHNHMHPPLYHNHMHPPLFLSPPPHQNYYYFHDAPRALQFRVQPPHRRYHRPTDRLHPLRPGAPRHVSSLPFLGLRSTRGVELPGRSRVRLRVRVVAAAVLPGAHNSLRRRAWAVAMPPGAHSRVPEAERRRCALAKPTSPASLEEHADGPIAGSVGS